RDFGARKRHRVASPLPQVADDPDELDARAVLESSIDEFVKDYPVDSLPILGPRDRMIEPGGAKPRRIHRPLHQVTRPDDSHLAKAARGRRRRDFLGDMEPWRGRPGADQIDRGMDGVVGTYEDIG